MTAIKLIISALIPTLTITGVVVARESGKHKPRPGGRNAVYATE